MPAPTDRSSVDLFMLGVLQKKMGNQACCWVPHAMFAEFFGRSERTPLHLWKLTVLGAIEKGSHLSESVADREEVHALTCVG